jgi:NAD(P)-dependent dehydrogenase (short-subunit alcohol dehydrogenase family)
MSKTAEQEQKVAVVTGCSSGIGFETSIALAKSGFYTYATMRKLGAEKSREINKLINNENPPLQAIELEVTNDKSVTNAIDTIVDERKRIDVVVNNAGYALGGALEETSMDELRAQFETNFFGAVRVMQAVIPIMRNQRSGKIVNITSMGGRISVPLSSFYHGTKFALEGLSESIQYELGLFGIKIILIEPGAVGSNFWKNIKIANKASSPSPNSPYAQLANSMSEAFKKMEQNAIHPSEVAKVILDAVTSDDPQLRYVVGKNMSDREFVSFMKKQLGI